MGGCTWELMLRIRRRFNVEVRGKRLVEENIRAGKKEGVKSSTGKKVIANGTKLKSKVEKEDSMLSFSFQALFK